MSQRKSGYERKLNDSYETPEWVTLALCPHIEPRPQQIWEPAAGTGKIARALCSAGFQVVESDIESGQDFLTTTEGLAPCIITNPPYGLAEQFIEHALGLAEFVAMLLRTDFDHAKTRSYLFAECPSFAKKIVLTRRIKWFENSAGHPSFNHAWFVWSRAHQGPPILAYAPPHDDAAPTVETVKHAALHG
jgi:hypothetical protein